jgi:MraZ protein
MFRGVHNISIDSKGRIKIPVRHQSQIITNCAGKMVLSIHPDDECLLLYPLGDWQKLELKVSALPSLNIHTKRIKRKLIGHATECEMDKVSRILIPVKLRQYGKINKKIILSGQGNNFEIWDEVTWKKHLDNLDSLSKREDLPPEISQLAL